MPRVKACDDSVTQEKILQNQGKVCLIVLKLGGLSRLAEREIRLKMFPLSSPTIK